MSRTVLEKWTPRKCWKYAIPPLILLVAHLNLTSATRTADPHQRKARVVLTAPCLDAKSTPLGDSSAQSSERRLNPDSGLKIRVY